MDKNEIILREADRADAASIAEIEKLCFPEAWSEKMVLSAMENGVFYIAAVSGGEIIGYAGGAQVLDEGQVANIALRPEFRGRGLGRRLTEALINRYLEKGCSVITLEVRHNNTPAISLYSSLGFVEVGRRKNYYSNPAADAILMTFYKGEVANG